MTADMSSHGVISPSKFLQTDSVQSLMFDRALTMLTQQADDTRFMLLPLGLVVVPSGMLAAFKAKGVTVAPLA